MTVLNNEQQRYKVCPTQIPPQLVAVSGARFIFLDTLKGGGKKPLERDWTTTNNYAEDTPKLCGWLRAGNDYGVATGFGDLHCFDADEVTILRELGIFERLPQTFTEAAVENKEHRWFIIPGLKKVIKMYHGDLHLGEVQSHGQHAVGPGSMHKSGNRRIITDDSPVATIEYDDLMRIFDECGIHTNHHRKTLTTSELMEYKTDTDEVSIRDIATPLHGEMAVGPNGREIRGEHPIHGARDTEDRGTSTNFSINLDKNTWHCFWHWAGGGWKEWVAVEEGIISCQDAGKGCLSGEKYRDVLKAAVRRGLIPESRLWDQPKSLATGMLRIEFDEIPDDPPEGETVVLEAPPRTGKTWAVIKWMIRNRGGNYFTHNHAIVEHAIKIFKECGGWSAVWVKGKKQPGACRTGAESCTGCPLKPDQRGRTSIKFMDLQERARLLLKEKKILTSDDVPADLCPYFVLKYAEEVAQFCFTVVNNIDMVVPRKITIIDEEPAIDYFYTPSVCIAEIKRVKGETHVRNNLTRVDDEVKEILEKIERRGLREYATIIQQISGIIEEEGEYGAIEVAEEIEKVLENWNPKYKHVRTELNDDEEITLEELVACLGNLWAEKKVSVQSGGNGYKKIYLMGDATKPVLNGGWETKTTTIVVIGATIAEMFVGYLKGKVWEINDFRYKDRFAVLAIDAEENGTKKKSRREQKKRVLEVAKRLVGSKEGTTRNPIMILAGSKRNQQQIMNLVGEGHASRNGREESLKWTWRGGEPIVFFQNSIISRGLDVDQYNVIFAYGTNFATPFWSVADPDVAAAIVRDETTNSILRISPTLRKDVGMAKVIVIPKDDLWKVRYLDGRETILDGPADKIADIIRKMDVAGEVGILEGGIGIKTIGTSSDGFKERLTKNLESSLNDIDPGTFETVRRMIEREMKVKRDHWYTIRELQDKTKMSSNHILHVLDDMRFKKLLETKRRAKYHMWKLKI